MDNEMKDLMIESMRNAITDAIEMIELILDEPDYIRFADLKRVADNLYDILKKWDALK